MAGHEQPVAAAKTRPSRLALEDHQLVAQDHHLDVAGQIADTPSEQPDETAQQQYARAKTTDRTSHEKEGRSYEPLAKATITSFRAHQASRPTACAQPWLVLLASRVRH